MYYFFIYTYMIIYAFYTVLYCLCVSLYTHSNRVDTYIDTYTHVYFAHPRPSRIFLFLLVALSSHLPSKSGEGRFWYGRLTKCTTCAYTHICI